MADEERSFVRLFNMMRKQEKSGQTLSTIAKSLPTLLLAAAMVSGGFAARAGAEPASGESQDALRRALENMGYIDVTVTGCRLAFSRKVTRSEENNGYYRYQRTLNLRAFERGVEFSLTSHVFQGRKLYAVEVPYNEAYRRLYSKAIKFRNWAMRDFREADWPYYFPQDYSEITPDLEKELQTRLPEVRSMNTWTRFTNFGRSTVALPSFRIDYDQRAPLKNFTTALVNRADRYGCWDTFDGTGAKGGLT